MWCPPPETQTKKLQRKPRHYFISIALYLSPISCALAPVTLKVDQTCVLQFTNRTELHCAAHTPQVTMWRQGKRSCQGDPCKLCSFESRYSPHRCPHRPRRSRRHPASLGASRPKTFCSAYILPVLDSMAIFVTPQSSKLFVTSLDVEEGSPAHSAARVVDDEN